MIATYIKWSKRALLLVCIGFFMPISCNCNGITLTKQFWNADEKGSAVCMALVFIAAAISIIYSQFYRDDLEEESLTADHVFLAISFFGGLGSIGRIAAEYSLSSFQIGAILIIIGWILSFYFLRLASQNKKT